MNTINTSHQDSKNKSLISIFFLITGMICAFFLVFVLISGRTFYFSSIENRLLSPKFEILKSSGLYGISFGIAGAILMILNLSYLVRRQWLQMTWLGALKHWMTFHVFTGLISVSFVLLHSTFILRSAMGSIAFYALLIVTITGLVGRYIYSRVPRSKEGKELELDEIRSELKKYRDQFRSYEFDHPLLTDDIQTKNETNRNFLKSFFLIIAGDPILRQNYETLRSSLMQNNRLQMASINLLPIAKKYCQIRQWFIRYYELRSFMGSWRFFHRWFAILTLAAVFFHILLSLLIGNLWSMK